MHRIMEVEWTAAVLNHTTLQQCSHMIQNGDGMSETSKTCQKWLTFQLYEDDVEGLQEPRAIENANNRIANAKLLMPCYTLKEKQNMWNSTIALENSNNQSEKFLCINNRLWLNSYLWWYTKLICLSFTFVLFLTV